MITYKMYRIEYLMKDEKWVDISMPYSTLSGAERSLNAIVNIAEGRGANRDNYRIVEMLKTVRT